MTSADQPLTDPMDELTVLELEALVARLLHDAERSITAAREEERMGSPNRNVRRLTALAGLALTLALAPTAFAVPVMPDGSRLGSEIELVPSSGAGVGTAVAHAPASGFTWGELAFVAAAAIAAVAVAAAPLTATGHRRPFPRKENDMLYPDPDTRLQLARERQADLQREALVASLARPAVVESAMRRRRLQVRRLRIRLRPAGHLSWR